MSRPPEPYGDTMQPSIPNVPSLAGDRVSAFRPVPAAQTLSTARDRSLTTVALVAVLATAVLLRLWGLFHDLPFSYFGDELHFMKLSAAMGSGSASRRGSARSCVASTCCSR